MRALAVAITVAFFGIGAGPAKSDPRSPFPDDAIHAATGIATFTEVPPPAARVHTQFHYDTVHVAEGITTFIESPSVAMVQGNITLIVGDQNSRNDADTCCRELARFRAAWLTE